MQKKHYFNWTYPTLEEDEKEEFYRHPSLPFSVNQLGAIFPDEGFSINNNYTQNKIKVQELGTSEIIATFVKSRGVLECYVGVSLEYERMPYIHFDGNGENYHRSNLLLRKDLTVQELLQANDNAKEFKSASIEYLDALCERLSKKGLDVQRYLNFLHLPAWLTYRGFKSAPVRRNNTLSKKLPNPKNLERMEACVKLREQGLSQVKIAQVLGLPSRMAVRYWLRRYDCIKREDIYTD